MGHDSKERKTFTPAYWDSLNCSFLILPTVAVRLKKGHQSILTSADVNSTLLKTLTHVLMVHAIAFNKLLSFLLLTYATTSSPHMIFPFADVVA